MARIRQAVARTPSVAALRLDESREDEQRLYFGNRSRHSWHGCLFKPSSAILVLLRSAGSTRRLLCTLSVRKAA